MGKKNKKDKKGQGAVKTAAKTEKKSIQKFKKELQSKGEEDIEKLLAEIQEHDRKNESITEEVVSAPTPRSSFTFTAHPDKEELLLFGGEYFNGQKTFLYNDLYIYHVKKKEWTLLKAPGAPPPRCAHQSVALSQGGGQLWVFGGEFSSPTQSQFHHYKDLWVFHLQHKRWEKITATGGPSARSGHRMVALKNQLVVFGGFHDNNRDYKYFNDAYIFNLETYKWLKMDTKGQAPSPRSGCQLAAISDGRILVYGGYSKDRIKKDVDRGIAHSDMFILQTEKGDATVTKWAWSQVKQSGLKPSPRCGCTMAVLPNGKRAYIFGGVYDQESEEALEGTFYNECYQLDVNNKKWHLVRLCGVKNDADRSRRRRAIKDEETESRIELKTDQDEGEKDKIDDDSVIPEHIDQLNLEEEMDLTERSDTMASSAPALDDVIFTVTIGPQNDPDSSDGDEQATGGTPSKQFVPRPRMNVGLVIKHGILYLYGGTYELGDKSITLADLHSLDLHKMDRWQTLLEYDDKEQEWMESESSDEDEDVEEESDSNDEDKTCSDEDVTGEETDEKESMETT